MTPKLIREIDKKYQYLKINIEVMFWMNVMTLVFVIALTIIVGKISYQ